MYLVCGFVEIIINNDFLQNKCYTEMYIVIIYSDNVKMYCFIVEGLNCIYSLFGL